MKKVYSLFIVLISILSCSITGKINPTNRTKNNSGNTLTSEIGKIYEQGNFNGFAVSLVDENGVLYQKGFGFSDVSANKKYTENTIQNIASVSKTLVGIALLKAQELGKLKLDDPIDQYLPFRVVNPYFPQEKITIRHLATHTSSIIDNEYYLSKNYILKPNQDLSGLHLDFDKEQSFNPYDSIMPMKSFLKNILDSNGKWYRVNSFLNNKPGAIYEYSNIGTALAAFVVERATGKLFNEFSKEYILNPLKMSASGWKFEEVNTSRFSRLYKNPKTVLPYYELITYPDGGFITSINDLSKYLTELIKGYNGQGTILTKESYKEYFNPQLSASNFIERNERNPYSESYNVGVFIGFGYTGYLGHTGGDPGVLSMMFFDPITNIGRIMILNTNFSDKRGNDAFYGIWNLLGKYQSGLKR